MFKEMVVPAYKDGQGRLTAWAGGPGCRLHAVPPAGITSWPRRSMIGLGLQELVNEIAGGCMYFYAVESR